jgi:hypothetical protein
MTRPAAAAQTMHTCPRCGLTYTHREYPGEPRCGACVAYLAGTSTFDPAHVIDLSAAALAAAMNGNWPAATTAVGTLDGEYGTDGICLAILAWVDHLEATDAHCRPGTNRNAFVKPIWYANGALLSADEVSGATRWAGWLIAARSNMDQAGFDAVFHSAPTDPAECGRYVQTLLAMVADTIRGLESGQIVRAARQL